MKICILLTLAIILLSCSHNPMITKSENQLRTIIAEMQSDMDIQRDEISKLRGQVEESEYKLNNKINKENEDLSSNYAVLKARLEIIEEYNNNQNEVNRRMFEAIQANEDRIIKINQNYSNFRKEKIEKNVKKDLLYATKLYEEKKYKESRKIYLEYLEKPHLLTMKEYRLILYRVALSEYRMKMNDDSIAHFSQLYQKFYKEGDKYMASSLYHIGSLLAKDKKCDEAKEIYYKIRKEYSKHKYFNKMSLKKINELKNIRWCKK